MAGVKYPFLTSDLSSSSLTSFLKSRLSPPPPPQPASSSTNSRYINAVKKCSLYLSLGKNKNCKRLNVIVIEANFSL
jgi:hypothetical protein